jgi:hypothetical protein
MKSFDPWLKLALIEQHSSNPTSRAEERLPKLGGSFAHIALLL